MHYLPINPPTFTPFSLFLFYSRSLHSSFSVLYVFLSVNLNSFTFTHEIFHGRISVDGRCSPPFFCSWHEVWFYAAQQTIKIGCKTLINYFFAECVFVSAYTFHFRSLSFSFVLLFFGQRTRTDFTALASSLVFSDIFPPKTNFMDDFAHTHPMIRKCFTVFTLTKSHT